MTTLFQNIQAEIKKFEADAGADFSALEAKIKALFESHATAPVPVVASAPPAVAVAAVLDTTPAAPATAPPAVPPVA